MFTAAASAHICHAVQSIRRVEKRLAAWTMLGVDNGEGIQVQNGEGIQVLPDRALCMHSFFYPCSVLAKPVHTCQTLFLPALQVLHYEKTQKYDPHVSVPLPPP